MGKTIWAGLAALVAVMCATTIAEAAPGRPDWCGSYKPGEDNKAKWVDGYIQSEGWSERVRQYVAAGACDKPDDAARQKDVEKWRAQYLATFGGTARDFSEMAAVFLDRDQREKQQEAVCKSLKTSGSETALAQSERVIAAQLRCSASPDSAIVHYWADRPDASEILRAASIVEEFSDDETFGRKYKSLALAIPEAASPERLDRAKLDAELAANPRYNAYAKVRLRELQNKARRYAEVWRATVNANPDVKKVLIDAPLEAVKAWESAYTAHKAAMDYAYESIAKIDADPSSAKGCSDKLRGYFSSYIAEKKPGSIDQAHALTNDYVGYKLLSALRLCEGVDGHAVASLAAGYELNRKEAGRELRGPRAAAYYAAVDAFAALLKNKKELPFKSLPQFEAVEQKLVDKKLPTSTARYWGKHSTGIVSKVTAGADGTVKVTFKKEPVKNYETECFENRDSIRGFDENGKIEYGWVCRPSGKFTITMEGEAPVSIPKEHAGLVSPGRTLTFAVDDAGNGRSAFPLEVFTRKDKKTLVGFLMAGVSADATATAPAKAPKAKSKKKKKKLA